MSDKLNSKEVKNQANEMWGLAKKELGGDREAGADFQQRLNYLSICGDKNGTPWSAVAKQMRADHAINQQRKDSGRPYDRELPYIQLFDGLRDSNGDGKIDKNDPAASIFITQSDATRKALAERTPIQKLLDENVFRRHPVDSTGHMMPGYSSNEKQGGPSYGQKECVNFDARPSAKQSRTLAPRG